MAPAVPVVEVADDADAAGVRRPDREVDAVDALVVDRVRAELVEEAQVGAFARCSSRPSGRAPGRRSRGRRPTIRRRRSAPGTSAAGALLVVSGPSKKPASWRRSSLPTASSAKVKASSSVAPSTKARATGPCRALVHAEDREGIGVAADDDRIDRRLVEDGRCGRLLAGGGLPLDCRLVHGLSPRSACLEARLQAISQMSSAYCRMVRSDENQPMRAVLRIAFFHQAVGSDQIASTSRCAAA